MILRSYVTILLYSAVASYFCHGLSSCDITKVGEVISGNLSYVASYVCDSTCMCFQLPIATKVYVSNLSATGGV